MKDNIILILGTFYTFWYNFILYYFNCLCMFQFWHLFTYLVHFLLFCRGFVFFIFYFYFWYFSKMIWYWVCYSLCNTSKYSSKTSTCVYILDYGKILSWSFYVCFSVYRKLYRARGGIGLSTDTKFYHNIYLALKRLG